MNLSKFYNFAYCALGFIALFGASSATNAQKTGTREIDLDASVEIKGEAINIIVAIARLANQNSVPIGLEVSSDDDLAEGSINLDIRSTTLKDALDNIVGQRRIYTWKVTDGVVNVYPAKSSDRDKPCVQVLDTRIPNLILENGTARSTFRDSILMHPEVRKVLRRHKLKPYREVYPFGDLCPLGLDYSAKMTNKTVRQIANQVIRDSATKYWVINRVDDGRKTLLFNL